MLSIKNLSFLLFIKVDGSTRYEYEVPAFLVFCVNYEFENIDEMDDMLPYYKSIEK